MIPQFPEFKKLEISDKSDIDGFVKKYPPYSDYNFTSLWSWNTKEQILISQLGTYLIIRFTDYITQEPFYGFLGTGDSASVVESMLDLSYKDGIAEELRLIPEASISELATLSINGVTLVEDRDNDDYILSVGEIAAMESSALHKHRNLVRNFEREHSSAEFVELNIKSGKICQDILDLFEKWAINKKIPEKEYVHEQKAILRHFACVRHYPNLLNVVGLYEDKELVGFGSYEIVHNKYAISHFQKALKKYVGVYQFLMYKIAQRLEKQGISFFNMEQDLGIEGLRKSKTLWNPDHFLKKFVLKR